MLITRSVAEVLKLKKIRDVLGVGPAATVKEAVALMNKSGVGAIVVRHPDGVVEGIFTERDVMRRIIGEDRDPAQTPITQVMSREVRRVPVEATVEDALRLMVEHGHRHLLVEDGKKSVGIVSIRDLMSWLVLPDAPIAHEGRPGVIRARAEETARSLRGSGG